MSTENVSNWQLIMSGEHNPLQHLDLAAKFYLMQVLAWMWSMVFSLSILSIFYFQYVWMAHLLVISGVFCTLLVFENAKRETAAKQGDDVFSHASTCVWKMDSEA